MFFNYSNLQKLLIKQKALDQLILKKSKLVVDNSLFLKQITALNVEVGELANEIKFFKHWQKNPNIKIEKIMYEYADVLHFYLSLALFFNTDFNFYPDYYYSMVEKFKYDTVYLSADWDDKFCIMFSYLFYENSKLLLNLEISDQYKCDESLFKILFYLEEIALLLEVQDFEEIYKYYFKKNVINTIRANSDY